jgi:thiamine biosynthesis lipoprotein ApbE/Na+-translocating ferredoxin:NAD+ oxidoreductase RnfG subunit
LLIAILLVRDQAQWIQQHRRPYITLRKAGQYFPKARRMEVRDPSNAVHVVTDPQGDTLGGLLTTAPQTDNLIGYSGPNNLLLALDARGAIVGVELLESGDTPEHVQKVRESTNFLSNFIGWRPNEESAPEIAAVSGATLTSLAMAEGIRQRLGGKGLSLRFPEALTLEEAKSVLTNAAKLEPEPARARVLDNSNHVVGFVARTAPQSDNISGYRGPSESLVYFGPQGDRVVALRIRKSYDTDSYVEQVRRSAEFRKLFEGRTLTELAALEYPRRNPDGVSGATRTARAVVEGVKRRFSDEDNKPPPPPRWRWETRDWGLTAALAGAIVMAFTSLRRYRWVRLGWQLLLVGYVGLVNHDLLSLALFGGWTMHGIPWERVPSLTLLALAAFAVPLTTRRQLYCHQICPHGAAQQILGKLLPWRWTPPPRLTHALEWLPGLLLGFALLTLLVRWPISLANLEPFDAWSWGAIGTVTLVIAIIGLAASLFVPQAYCRFGCPTGALLSFIRSSGAADRWGRRDWSALCLLAVSFVAVAGVRARSPASRPPEPELLRGRTMGTTWSVKIHDELAMPAVLEAAIAKEFEWAESLTSNWRTNTTLSEFNRTATTNAMAVPWAVLTLARWGREISENTGGAYDITVGPLVRLWGFGPNARTNLPPTDAEVEAVRPSVGWQKLELLDGMMRKQVPSLEVDLSSIAKGWAIDKIVDLLVFRGYTNFLVEAGGELRAVGRWNIAIEHPDRPCTLNDEAIATSGTYRQNYASGGKRFSHLIDPRTGRPIAHNTVSVSVRHADCGHADAWATALNVLGMEEGLPLAERLHLAAQFVVEQPNGKLTVLQSSAWPP